MSLITDMIELPDEQQYHGHEDVQVGDRVTASGYRCAGIVRFVGVVNNTDRTHGKPRVGIELDKPEGKHDGAVSGQRYFRCPDKHGILVPHTRAALLSRKEEGPAGGPGTVSAEHSGDADDSIGFPTLSNADGPLGFGDVDEDDGASLGANFGFDTGADDGTRAATVTAPHRVVLHDNGGADGFEI